MKVFFENNIIENLDFLNRKSVAEFLNLLDVIELDDKKKTVIRKSFLDIINSNNREVKAQVRRLIS